VVVFENRSVDNVLGHLYGPNDGKTFEGVLGKDNHPGRSARSCSSLVAHGAGHD
jgi:hypothetical protein